MVNYSPRPKAQIDQITALVRSAIGFDKDRGDQVQVINLRFAEIKAPALADIGPQGWLDTMKSLSKADYFTIAELTVIGIMSLLVLMLVVRPLVRRILTPEAPTPNMKALTADDAQVPQLTVPDDETLSLTDARNQTLEALDSARAVGKVQAKAMEDVGETVQNNPEEAVSIVRDWIQKTA